METKIDAIIKTMESKTAPNIDVYSTGAGLGYKETAFLIRVSPQYMMCVGLYADQNTYPQSYRIGGLVEEERLLNLEIANSRFAIDDSPLWGTYPFHALLYGLQNPL